MQIIDSHCHLAHPRLYCELEAVLKRARRAGVVGIICATGDLEEAAKASEIAGANADVFFTAGVHPHEAKDAGAGYLEKLANIAALPKNAAIGEIGLDYHYDFSPRPDQREVFRAQLALAKDLGKPVVIHTREAFDDTLAILQEVGIDPRRVLFHSFTENTERIARVIELGAMVSFSGIITFNKSTDLQAAAAIVPPQQLMVETDAPYLSPEPVRKQKTNEPANVVHVAEFISRRLGIAWPQFEKTVLENTRRFFAMPSGW